MLGKLFGKGAKDGMHRSNAIPGGPQKTTGGHDHRSNTGDDRTPAQKKADKKRRGY